MTYSWPDHFQPAVVREAYRSNSLLSSYCIAVEAWRRGLRVTFKDSRLARFEIHDGTRGIDFNFSRPTTLTADDAVRLTHDKYATTEALRAAEVACPLSIPFESAQSSFAQVAEAAEQVGYPVVIKPRRGSRGRGVLAGIADEEELRTGYQWLTEEFQVREFVLEKHFEGGDHRVYVVGDKAVAVGVKVPAHVVGDGRHTIDELIDQKNHDRSSNPYLGQAPIARDYEVDSYIGRQGYTYDSVLQAGVHLRLRGKANASAGGDFHDQTEVLPDHIKEAAVRSVAAIDGVVTAGVDILYDPAKPHGEDYVVIELNDRPHIGLNMYPTHGTGRDIPAAIVDAHFPDSRRLEVAGLQTLSINLEATTAPLRNRTAEEVVIRPLPEDGLPVRRTFLINELNKLTGNQRNRLMAASRKTEVSGALNEQHGVMILGGTEAALETFCERVSAITQCSVTEDSDYWDGPMELGFVLRR